MEQLSGAARAATRMGWGLREMLAYASVKSADKMAVLLLYSFALR